MLKWVLVLELCEERWLDISARMLQAKRVQTSCTQVDSGMVSHHTIHTYIPRPTGPYAPATLGIRLIRGFTETTSALE